jgi:6-pyruvoyltetrahydropterin/6-carboxytetrahydropterin synthase
MPMIYISRRATFSASHTLYLGKNKNKQFGGKCANPYGHGHNYELVVTLRGDPHAKTGMVYDLNKLKKVIHKEIIKKVDHKHLNHEVSFLKGIIPTSENLAKIFWHRIQRKLPQGMLFEVRLKETENNQVYYRGS